MINRKIAERRWLKEPTQLQWRVTLPSAKTTQLYPIKRVGYLSLKRKYPTNETTPITNEIISVGVSNPYSRPRLISFSIANINQIKNEPIVSITNIFWTVFILQFNTVTPILVVTQVL